MTKNNDLIYDGGVVRINDELHQEYYGILVDNSVSSEYICFVSGNTVEETIDRYEALENLYYLNPSINAVDLRNIISIIPVAE